MGPQTPCREWQGVRHSDGYGIKQHPSKNKKQVHIHRWVMEQAGHDIEGKVVRHKCDNPPCFRYDHLEIGSQEQNVQDMFHRGRHRRKLTDEQVLEIFASADARKVLSSKYGVSRVMVGLIQNGKSYSWLTNPSPERLEK